MAINRSQALHYLFITILCVAIFLLLLIEIILNLTPPIARDALIHHLAVPKLWLKNGGFYDIKWAEFSYYPMNVDLLYLIPLYFKKDFLANFIHMGFGIGTALLIYHYLKNKIESHRGTFRHSCFSQHARCNPFVYAGLCRSRFDFFYDSQPSRFYSLSRRRVQKI